MKIRVPTLLLPPGLRAAAPPKVMVGYPVGGSVTLAFHASVLSLLGYEIAKGDDRLLARITHSQGLYVADNRTLLIQRFLSTEAEWLLQVDTDIAFPPTLLETMVELAGTERKVLAASVPLSDVLPTCAFNRTEVPGIFAPQPKFEGVIECDAVATAVLLVHRSVLLDIADLDGQSWMHHLYLPASNVVTDMRHFVYRSQGEDLAFCMRAKKAGHRIWCARVHGLRHHKALAMSHDYDLKVPTGDPGVGVVVDDELVEEVG